MNSLTSSLQSNPAALIIVLMSEGQCKGECLGNGGLRGSSPPAAAAAIDSEHRVWNAWTCDVSCAGGDSTFDSRVSASISGASVSDRLMDMWWTGNAGMWGAALAGRITGE